MKVNREHYHPGTHSFTPGYLLRLCHTPSDHNVGLKDNVWAQMLLICRLVKHSEIPWCQLSSKFEKRLAWYDVLMNQQAWTKGLTAGKEHSPPFMKAFFHYMQKKLQKCVGSNLFGDLIPETPMDDIVMRMAAIDPTQRIPIQEATRLFKLAARSSSSSIYFEKVYPGSKSAPTSLSRSSGSTQEQIPLNLSDPNRGIKDDVCGLPSIPNLNIFSDIHNLPSAPNHPTCIDLQHYVS